MLHCVGGKGVNFARVLSRLGHDVTVLGVSAGHSGRFMEDSLGSEGLPFHMVRAPGESRLATTIMDPATGVHTEVNEVGPEVGPDVVAAALDAFRQLLVGTEYCVIAGSAPPGAPDSIYAPMVRACHEAGVPVMLDTSRQWLRAGAYAGPSVLKPNIAELTTLLGRELAGLCDVAGAARGLVRGGTETVLVTLGEQGAIAVTACDALHAVLADSVTVLSPVGSGDAFAAGYVAGLLEGGSLTERVALAVACGTANAMVFGPGYFSRPDAELWLGRVRVVPVGLEPSSMLP